MKEFLAECEIINFSHPLVAKKAKELRGVDDEETAKNCFNFVLNEINHSGDICAKQGTITASEVLEFKTGWCYAKSHLLCALLRANKIPCALCYQRLSCSDYNDGVFCLHGLNSIYLKKYGWYRVDARGNKEGIEARFSPPHEKLAFDLKEFEFEVEGRFATPMESVLEALTHYDTYETMIKNFPDIKVQP